MKFNSLTCTSLGGKEKINNLTVDHRKMNHAEMLCDVLLPVAHAFVRAVLISSVYLGLTHARVDWRTQRE